MRFIKSCLFLFCLSAAAAGHAAANKGGAADKVTSKTEALVSKYFGQGGNTGEPDRKLFSSIPLGAISRAEVHVVSGNQTYGWQFYHACYCDVNVTVNRPGKRVLLILHSMAPTQWHVSASAGTVITAIVANSLKPESPGKPETTVSAQAKVYWAPGLSVPTGLKASGFDSLFVPLQAWSGRRRIDSFLGEVYIPDQIDISQAEPNNPLLSMDFPPVQAAPLGLAFNLRDRGLRQVPWGLAGPASSAARGARYFNEGKLVVAPEGNTAYMLDGERFSVANLETGAVSELSPPPPDFPKWEDEHLIAYDTRRGVVALISSFWASDSTFLRFDVRKRRWLDHRAIDAHDLLAFAYDSTNDSYLVLRSDGEVLILSATGELRARRQVIENLPGYERMYQGHNADEHFIGIAPRGNDLAIIGYRGHSVARVWYFNLATGKARLTYKAK